MSKTKAISVEAFLKAYSGAPYDREQVAQAAARVDGIVGAAAKAWLAADALLTEALKSVGYEEG
jgi:hypothetical protein